MKTSILHLLFLIPTLLVIKSSYINAQEIASKDYVKNQIFLELGGDGIIYSINYERLLTENIALRGGIGITPGMIFIDGTFFGIPLTVSYLIGGGRSKLELGLGVTYFTVEDAAIFGIPAGDFSFAALTGIVGYRGSSRDRGFVFRIAFTPLYNSDFNPSFVPTGGISFGYAF